MNKTEYQKRMLAEARDAEEKPVHEGLRIPIKSQWLACTIANCTKGKPFHSHRQVGKVPNPDPMALLLAAQVYWEVTLPQGGGVFILTEPSPYDDSGKGVRSDNPVDAVFQATEPLAANWMDCPNCGGVKYGFKDDLGTVVPPCQDCHGTGKVLKEG